ncbi:MAG TPA: hypothetical protein VN843_19465, partial [Anaerolineales bacterium]|nr:hypothetical protein [Anaerolineales bacterium]
SESRVPRRDHYVSSALLFREEDRCRPPDRSLAWTSARRPFPSALEDGRNGFVRFLGAIPNVPEL